eukprot:Nk52_evm38s2496 gene=Nk52_evmTU38s2496
MTASISKTQKYDRQIRLWGDHGQKALQQAKVCVINGGSATGSELLKNLVLPALGSFTVVDGHVVDGKSIGNNFFLDYDSMGHSRAQRVTELLSELNSDVAGNFVNNEVDSVLDNGRDFFKDFSVVIATQLNEIQLLRLGQVLWDANVPMLVVRTYGFIGYMRLVVKEHCVIESHPESSIDDLRLDVPFEGLRECYEGLNIDAMSDYEHSHVPYLLILAHYLDKWRKGHGDAAPKTRAEKDEFKRILLDAMRKDANGFSKVEENFEEAVKHANKAWIKTSIPSDVQAIFDDSACCNLTADSSPFWIVANALKEFVAKHNGVLPLRGSIPDMASDSDGYILLQKVFAKKAKSDYEEVLKITRSTLQQLGVNTHIEDSYVRLMCKNAFFLRVIRTRSLTEEYELESSASRIISDTLEDPENNNIMYYCVLRGVDLFCKKYKRYPGELSDAEYEEDIGRLQTCVNNLLQDWGVSLGSLNIKADIVQEMVRFGNSEPHTMAAFMGGIGSQEVIKLLTQHYLSAVWFDMYLRMRDSLPINSNPFMAWKPEEDSRKNEQSVKAASLLTSSLRFYHSLRDGILAPDWFETKPEKSSSGWFKNLIRLVPTQLSYYGAYFVGAYPLDMSQYVNLFCSTREPCREKDVLRSYPNSEHIVAIHNGRFYKINCYDNDKNIRPTGEFVSDFKAILADKDPALPINESLAVMTAANRDVWADTRSKVIGHIGTGMQVNESSGMSVAKGDNALFVRDIDSAIFIISLDDIDEDIEDDEGRNKLSKQFLANNPENRWFEKSFQLIVAKNGLAGVHFEHAWGDGVSVLRYFNNVYENMVKDPLPEVKESSSKPIRLDFEFADGVKKSIESAYADYDKLNKKLDMSVLEWPGFGKSYCKSKKISPDGICHVAMQITWFRLFGFTPNTYESCTTAAFKKGRTEVVRPATLECQAFVEKFLEARKENKLSNNSELVSALRSASAIHGKHTLAAATGKGVDRHLFMLKRFAEEKGDLPSIFTDKAYQKLNYNELSTSTLPSPHVVGGGFGAVVPDGIGMGYMIDDRRVGISLTSFTGNSQKFRDTMKDTLEEIKTMLETST